MRTLCILALAACGTLPAKTVVIGDEASPFTDTDPRDETEVNADTGTEVVAIDTGTYDTAPVDTAVFDPLWEREFDILITADDQWTMYIDGQTYYSNAQNDWRLSDHIVQTIQGRDRQVIAVHARDNHNVIAGLIAVVQVSHELYSVTGDGQWKMTTEEPPPDWTLPHFDDSSWTPAFECSDADQAVWGTYWVADFVPWGARWIWHGPCRDLGQAWFRLVVE